MWHSDEAALLSREAVAADWYDNIYLKSVTDIEAAGLDELMPQSPISDLYLWVHQRRQSLYPDRGSMSFRTAAEDLVEEESRRLTTRAKKKVARVEDSVGGVVDRLKRSSDQDGQ